MPRVLRGTIDSPADRRRVDPIYRMAEIADLDDLEVGAYKLSVTTQTQLPTILERNWGSRYWCKVGPRLLERHAEQAEQRGSLEAALATLNDPNAMSYLVWLGQYDRLTLEVALLRLERCCEARHVFAVKRAVRCELTKEQHRRRDAKFDVGEAAVHSISDEAITRALDALAKFVRENRALLWNGRGDRNTNRRSQGRWVGRWDGSNSAVAIEAEVVRGLLGKHGDPEAMLDVLQQRGLVRMDPQGRRRWQRRVGGRGIRLSCIGISQAALAT
jgi:hypothetical protein